MRNELFRRKLQQELVDRISRNPNFSARAFAKQLQIEPSSLNQILRGKRPLTDKMCKRLAEKLSYSPQELSYLMGLKNFKIADPRFKKFSSINEDSFRVISDWYHYAILELTSLKRFRPDKKWIARTLSISLEETEIAIDRLLRLGYLEITEHNTWIDRLGDVNNPGNEYTAPAMRKLQKQILNKAITALDEIPYEERIQSSMTLKVKKSRLIEAKQRVLNFIEEMDAFLKHDDDCEEVYNMSFSLYPLSRTIGEM